MAEDVYPHLFTSFCRNPHLPTSCTTGPSSPAATSRRKSNNAPLHDIKIIGFARVSQLGFNPIPSDTPIRTRVPASPIDSKGTTECVIHEKTRQHLLNMPNYPRSSPPTSLEGI
ncbi:hypothetical protein BDQ17DRAFT_1332890 [Cyathus striatus]|nr:hypothetical protein BDQ17DRAFT_1332890 [Cyathus striatus]